MHPALAKLVESGQLKSERSSADEVQGFLAHAAHALDDAAVRGLSASGRFEFGYTAAHALAFAALRAHDLRPAIRPGHRAIVFLTLAQTIDAPAALWSSLNRYHTKRNKSEYGQWVEASEAEARDLLKLATDLRERTMRWLKTHRQGLIG